VDREVPDYLASVSQWSAAASAVLNDANGAVRITEDLLAERYSDFDSSTSPVRNLIDAADGVVGHLANAIEANDDDAFQTMFSFLVGNLAVADAVATAADERGVTDAIRIETSDDVSPESRQRDVDDAVNALRGPGRIGGAAVPGDPLSASLSNLTDQSGQQLVEIARDAILSAALPEVGPALAKLVNGKAASVFEGVQTKLNLVWAALKRAASKIIDWVIDHITRLIPSALDEKIAPAVKKVRASLTGDANNLIGKAVGDVAGMALGLKSTRTSWANASPATVASAANNLPKATDGELALIAKVDKVRRFLDRYGSWLDGLTKIPQVVLALATLAVIAMVLVLSALWSGLRNVRVLVEVN
jgi:hypothetical protein